MTRSSTSPPAPDGSFSVTDPQEELDRLLRDLRTRTEGLSSREAERLLAQMGTNDLVRQKGEPAWRELLRQLIHPWRCCCGWRRSSPGFPVRFHWPSRSWWSSS